MNYFTALGLAFLAMGIMLVAVLPILGIFWLLDVLDIKPGWGWLVTILLTCVFDAATVTYLIARFHR